MKRMPEMTDAEEIVWLLGEAFRRSRQLVDQVVRDAGITATQLGILKRIEHTPGISRSELARQNFISPQAAQVHLRTLEAKGLVARRAGGRGKRGIGTHLTAKGRRVLKACGVVTGPVLEKFVVRLLPEERRELKELLLQCLEGVPDWP
jgi:DNA-binding MarR family transcriptional regulator